MYYSLPVRLLPNSGPKGDQGDHAPCKNKSPKSFLAPYPATGSTTITIVIIITLVDGEQETEPESISDLHISGRLR